MICLRASKGYGTLFRVAVVVAAAKLLFDGVRRNHVRCMLNTLLNRRKIRASVFREGDIAALRQLLEPKYRAMGAAPPPVPTWAGRASFGDRDGSRLEPAVPIAAGSGPSRRVIALLRSSPLFVIGANSVKAKVVVAPAATSAAAEDSSAGEPEPEFQDAAAAAARSASSSATAVVTRHRRHACLVHAAVKALTGVIGRACEAQEEVFLKARLPGAQAYTVELERYRSEIVSGVATRAFEGSPGTARSSAEIDDDLWRLFAVRETRLYSSSAALGKKPGRIYVTYNTLWFHSKVLGEAFLLLVPLYYTTWWLFICYSSIISFFFFDLVHAFVCRYCPYLYLSLAPY